MVWIGIKGDDWGSDSILGYILKLIFLDDEKIFSHIPGSYARAKEMYVEVDPVTIEIGFYINFVILLKFLILYNSLILSIFN